ncbi:MAG: hypothetical protein WDN45_17465 [Caulobacteraceae bacterium]
MLEGSIDEGMTPLSTRRPLWGAAYRLTAIDRSIIELSLRGHPGAAFVFRGPNAPPAPPMSEVLAGQLERIDIKSVVIGQRRIEGLCPSRQGARGGWPVVIAAASRTFSPTPPSPTP